MVRLISPIQIGAIPATVISYMTLDQLRFLTPATSSNITGDQLGNLTATLGPQFVTLYPSSALTTDRQQVRHITSTSL